jgi:hypothetical protein
MRGWWQRATEPTRDVVRLGPGSLRGKAGRNAAMDVLTELGRAWIERDGQREHWPAIRLPSWGRPAGTVPVPAFPLAPAEPLHPSSLMVLLFVKVTGIDSSMGLPLRATALHWVGCTMPIRWAPPSPAVKTP